MSEIKVCFGNFSAGVRMDVVPDAPTSHPKHHGGNPQPRGLACKHSWVAIALRERKKLHQEKQESIIISDHSILRVPQPCSATHPSYTILGRTLLILLLAMSTGLLWHKGQLHGLVFGSMSCWRPLAIARLQWVEVAGPWDARGAVLGI